jgi:hypothetical protein
MGGRLAPAGAVLSALLLASCNQDGSTGYVELKTVPGTARLPAIYLDAGKVEAKPGGVTVLRQAVGTARLQTDGGEGKILLCHVVVKKNRITTITLSPLERPPRCQCERVSGADGAASRTCIG